MTGHLDVLKAMLARVELQITNATFADSRALYESDAAALRAAIELIEAEHSENDSYRDWLGLYRAARAAFWGET